MEETLVTPPPRKKSLRRRLVKIFGISAGLVAALVFITPYVLSADVFRRNLEEAASRALGVPVQLEDYSLSWFSGFSMAGLYVPNPPGFPQREPMLELRSMRGDFSFFQLLRGRLDVSGTVEGLEIRVHQQSDGTTNVERLAGVEIDLDERDRREIQREWRGSGLDLSGLRLDLNLLDALIEVSHADKGVLESLRKVNGSISKAFGDNDLRLAMDAEIHRPEMPEEPGRLQLTVDVDTTGRRPLEIDLDTNGLDLSRYRPLIAVWVPPEQIAILEGVASGTLRGHYDYRRTVSLNGSLTIDKPRLSGAVVADLDLRSPRWVINPHVEIELAEDTGSPPRLDAEGTFVDLGFLTVTGMSAEEMRDLGEVGIGLRYSVDLDAVSVLSEFPGDLDRQASLDGVLTLSGLDSLDHLFEIADLRTSGTLNLPSLRVETFDLRGFRGDLQMENGVLQLASSVGVLNSGPIELQVAADLHDLADIPLTIDLDWQQGAVTADAVRVLRYVVPLFAGLDEAAELDFKGGVTSKVHLAGPALPDAGEHVLQWLNRWSGAGELHLVDGAFVPAPQLQALLAAAGERDRIRLDELDTDFTIAEGYVETALMELENKGRRYGVRGRTSLSGDIDYSIDLTQMLAGHGTGDRIREALGNQPILAHLRGTLERPVLGMPDISDALQAALQNAARNALEKGLKDLFKKIR